MTLAVLTATIPAGQSLSAAVDVGLGDLVRFYMPPAWSPANLTFQMSPDNVAYSDLFNQDSGGEFMIGVRPNVVIVTGVQWRALAWMKIRSGTSGRPVIQAQDRVFKLVVLK